MLDKLNCLSGVLLWLLIVSVGVFAGCLFVGIDLFMFVVARQMLSVFMLILEGFGLWHPVAPSGLFFGVLGVLVCGASQR